MGEQTAHRSTVSSMAPGKLMLLGEHSVVYGRKCIVTAVDAPVTATVSHSEKFFFDAPDLKFSGIVDMSQADYPKEIAFAATSLKNFCGKFGINLPVAITTKSILTEGKKVGLGSSASVTAALMKALSAHFSIPVDNKQLFELCYKTVLDVQKVGSGFDVAAAVYGGTILYSKGVPEPISCEGLNLIIGYTGVPASTPEIVKKVGAAVSEQPDYYEGIFDEIEQIVLLAKDAMQEKDWAAFGSLMNENQQLLRELKVPSQELGVSSEILEKLISAALDSGAYGAKLSGAGIGDCMIAVAPLEKTGDVKQAIQQAGGTVINANSNVEGARII